VARVLSNLTRWLAPVVRMNLIILIVNRLALFSLIVIERTVRLLTLLILLRPTWLGFVLKRVVFKFLPPMAHAATVFKLAPIFERFCILFGFPAWALSVCILIHVGRATEVLPVVRVKA
jgi:hypothetical protein